jgi:hypothetical protein
MLRKPSVPKALQCLGRHRRAAAIAAFLALAVAAPGDAFATVNWGPGGTEVKTGSVPLGGTMDASGNIYSTNYGASNVTRVTPSGISSGTAPLYNWGPVYPVGGSGPCDAAVDSSGNVYVVNSTGDADGVPGNEGSVTRFQPDGTSTINWGPSGAPVLIPSGSCGITVGSAGNVYTTDPATDSVTWITPGGVVTTGWASTGDEPGAVTADSAGNLYTANSVGTVYTDNGVGGTVTKISPSGVSSGNTGNGYRWAGIGSGPTDIAVDSSGNVFTANQNSNTVTRITPSGVSSGNTGDGYRWFAGGGSNPLSVTTDSGGNVYVGYHGTDDAWKVTPDGSPTRLGSTGDNPFWIGLDSSCNVYTVNGASNVSKLANAGTCVAPPGAGPSDPVPSNPAPSNPSTPGSPVKPPANSPAEPVRPAKPAGSWPSAVRNGRVAVLITPAAGVTCLIGAQSGKKIRRGTCRSLKVTEGRKKVTRISCAIRLPRGTWTVSITPVRDRLAGLPITRTYKVRR